jgi:hypothetical protein
MITIKKSDNLFHSKRVALDYLATDVAEPSIGYGAVHWLEMRMAGADNEQQFEQFLDAFFSGLKAAFAVQLFCYERSAQPKSRPRAYAKLFYELRRANIIGAERMIEKELEVDEHYSVLAGIIEADEVDNEILLNEIRLWATASASAGRSARSTPPLPLNGWRADGASGLYPPPPRGADRAGLPDDAEAVRRAGIYGLFVPLRWRGRLGLHGLLRR